MVDWLCDQGGLTQVSRFFSAAAATLAGGTHHTIVVGIDDIRTALAEAVAFLTAVGSDAESSDGGNGLRQQIRAFACDLVRFVVAQVFMYNLNCVLFLAFVMLEFVF